MVHATLWSYAKGRQLSILHGLTSRLQPKARLPFLWHTAHLLSLWPASHQILVSGFLMTLRSRDESLVLALSPLRLSTPPGIVGKRLQRRSNLGFQQDPEPLVTLISIEAGPCCC